jgi:energy-converting hydrogenase Eha subunit A
MYADAGAALQADQEAAAQQAAIAEASTYDGTMPDTQPPAEVTAATPVPLTPDQQYAQDSEAWATVKDIFNSPVIKYGAQALSLAVAPAAAIKGMLTQAAFGVLGNVANKYAANNPGTVGANAINAANNIGNVLSGGMGLFNAGNTVMRAGPAAAAGNLAAALALGRSISSVPARANQMQAGLTGLGVPSAQTGMAAGDSGGLTSTGGGGNVVAYTGAPSAGAMPPLQPTALRVLRAPPPRGQGMMSQNTRVLRAPRPIGA